MFTLVLYQKMLKYFAISIHPSNDICILRIALTLCSLAIQNLNFEVVEDSVLFLIPDMKMIIMTF